MQTHYVPRPEFDLPAPHYRLVQRVRTRLGFIASASLTCYLFGEIPRLAGISAGEADLIFDLAREEGISMSDRGRDLPVAV